MSEKMNHATQATPAASGTPAPQATPANQATPACDHVLLSHVNAAPSQTWNWLSINETKVELPLPEGVSKTDLEESLKAAEKTLSKKEGTSPSCAKAIEISAKSLRLGLQLRPLRRTSSSRKRTRPQSKIIPLPSF